jgi:transglutaminase-like putative cysteine protease
MAYRITHTTEYQYAASVSGSHNMAHLLPVSYRRQRCLDSDLEIDPQPRALRHYRDYFGNTTTYFDLAHSHQRMRVTVISRVEVLAPPAVLDDRPWELIAADILEATDERSLLAREFKLASPYLPILPEIQRYAAASFLPARPFVEAVTELMARIHTDFKYKPGATTIATPLAEVIASKEGVCQDFAHLMIACMRSLGFPACYISGYIETVPPPGQIRLVGADATHAWLSVYSPRVGWMEFDPTNDLVPDLRHIRLAKGRDYGDVAPLKGVLYGGGEHKLTVNVDVCPL